LMSRPAALALAIFMATGLAGCMSEDPSDVSFKPYSIDDRYPLGVAKTPVTMDVDASGGALAPRQARAIAGLAQQAAASGVTPVTVSAGGGSQAVARQVVQVLQQNGVAANMINKAHHRGAGVRISFVQSNGTSRECGIWDKDATDTALNEPYTNHGCAVRANIAAMVADPADLVIPKTPSTNPSNNGAAAVGRVNGGAQGRPAIYY
jgi:pilus assembly protein CpaD